MPTLRRGTSFASVRAGRTTRPPNSAGAAQFAATALQRDGGDALALAILGHVHSYLLKDPVTGAEYLAHARDLSPSSAMAWALSSNTSTYLGRGANSITQAEQALRLAPLDAHAFFYEETMALALYWSGEYPEAVAWAERSVRHNPAFSANLRCLVAGLMALGREDDARIYARLLLEVEPHFNIEEFLIRSPFQRLVGPRALCRPAARGRAPRAAGRRRYVRRRGPKLTVRALRIAGGIPLRLLMGSGQTHGRPRR